MATTLELPALGNSMEEGTITRWFKAEGDAVAKGEALYEVMTDKVNMEVEAPEAGTLRKILAAADATVAVNAPVAIWARPDEDISALLGERPAGPRRPPRPQRWGCRSRRRTAADADAVAAQTPGTSRGASSPARAPGATPTSTAWTSPCSPGAARAWTGAWSRPTSSRSTRSSRRRRRRSGSRRWPPAVAAAHGVPVQDVPGSGPGGKVTHDDVRRARSAPAPAPAARPRCPRGPTAPSSS